jgi:hypothetical protein
MRSNILRGLTLAALMLTVNKDFLFYGLLISGIVSSPAAAQLEPDRTIASVGKWKISTARYGVGCVAWFDYATSGYQISISGKDKSHLKLLITVQPKAFDIKLDGSEEDTSAIEIALTDNRWGNVKDYGYRGTSGVVLGIDSAFLNSFASSKSIKITERGYEKLRSELGNPKLVLAKLQACFARG